VLGVSPYGWNTEQFDVGAYLAQIGVEATPPSRAALDQLLEAHVRRFTFDNIDVLLDQHPGVALDAVQAKFVGRGRGGYCFEHASLLAAALDHLGYDVERRLGRVGDPINTARTHMVVTVSIDGDELLADPGFGLSTIRPIALADGADDDYLGWPLQVREVPEGVGRSWELHRLGQDGWDYLYTIDSLPVRPIDVVHGHHYTSTFPDSHFRHGLMVAGHVGEHHVTVTHQTVTIRVAGEPTEHRQMDVGELQAHLRQLRVPLDDDEERRLLGRVAELRSEPAH
jgi:N-hydroxyarylamine O-acetyltransferase